MEISADAALVAVMAPSMCAAGVASFFCAHQALTSVVLSTVGRLAHGIGALACWLSLFVAGFVWMALARDSWLWPDLVTALYAASWVLLVVIWSSKLRAARKYRQRLVVIQGRGAQATKPNTNPPPT